MYLLVLTLTAIGLFAIGLGLLWHDEPMADSAIVIGFILIAINFILIALQKPQ